MNTTKKLSEEEIGNRLIGRGIRLVSGSFKNIRVPARWICLVDSSHGEFEAPAKQIIHANGSCPLCGKVGKLTDEIVKLKVQGRPLSLVIGSLKGSDKKAEWLCLANPSHPTWQATPSSVINKKSGCPVCSGKQPLNEEAICSKLEGRTISLVSRSYVPSKKIAKWRCLKNEQHPIWSSSISSVIYQHSGCPVCSGNAPITEEQINLKLVGRPIRLVSNTFVGGVLKKTMWQCLSVKDHPNWSATPDSVLSGTNCPACTGHERLTSEVVRRKLKSRNIDLLTQIVTSSTDKVTWACKKDVSHRNWSATVSSVLAGSGCPECAGNARLNEALIDERLSSRAIRIVDNTFKSTSEKAEWKCLSGKGHPNWFSNVGSILSGVGCPNCAEYGFDENKKAYFYLMLIGEEIAPIGVKCGITNNDPKFRLQQIRRKSKEEINLINTWLDSSGKFIRNLERKVLEKFPYNDLGNLLKDGGTETLFATDLFEIVRFVEAEFEIRSKEA
jgi:hypothetical protein